MYSPACISLLMCIYNALLIYIQSRSEPNPNIRGKRSFVPNIWKSVTFFDILCVLLCFIKPILGNQCTVPGVTIPNVTMSHFGLCDVSRFLSHGMNFFSFFSKTQSVEKTQKMSQISQICSLYRALFRRSLNIYVSKLCFAVVWLGQIQNLNTGHVYVLDLKSGSERLLYSSKWTFQQSYQTTSYAVIKATSINGTSTRIYLPISCIYCPFTLIYFPVHMHLDFHNYLHVFHVHAYGHTHTSI